MESAFTTNEFGVSLAVNSLEATCITNPNNKFGIDSEGNIHANSLSLVNDNITIGNTDYLQGEEIEPGLVKLKDNQSLYGTIIEEGSNSDGTYIKFSNGTLICLVEKNLGYLNFSTPWGALYELENSIDLGSYPHKFSNTPYINITAIDNAAIIESLNDRGNNKIGTINLMRPNVNTYTLIKLSIFAIGRWK